MLTGSRWCRASKAEVLGDLAIEQSRTTVTCVVMVTREQFGGLGLKTTDMTVLGFGP
jgi:hypothetical protein